MINLAKNTICLWYNRDAEEAARFYAKTFPDSAVGEVYLAPGDFPSGKQGDVLTKPKRTFTGTPSLATVDRRARAVGARTDGDYLGKSRRSRSRKRSRTPIPLPRSVHLMR